MIRDIIAFLIGISFGFISIFISNKIEKLRYKKRKKKEVEYPEAIIFDGVDDYVKCGEKGLKDYDIIKGDCWEAGKEQYHSIIIQKKTK